MKKVDIIIILLLPLEEIKVTFIKSFSILFANTSTNIFCKTVMLIGTKMLSMRHTKLPKYGVTM